MSKITFCNTGMTIERLEGALMNLLHPYDPAQWNVIMKAFQAGVAVGLGDVRGEESWESGVEKIKARMDAYAAREKPQPMRRRASERFKKEVRSAGVNEGMIKAAVLEELDRQCNPQRHGGYAGMGWSGDLIDMRIYEVCNGRLTTSDFFAWFEDEVLNHR